jgi:hypothetical protein
MYGGYGDDYLDGATNETTAVYQDYIDGGYGYDTAVVDVDDDLLDTNCEVIIPV